MFDQNGLWRYRDIFFSKHGNLRQTVIHLVNHSQYGFTAKEIEDIMRLSPNSFLSYFRRIQELYCEELSGRAVYFSHDKVVLSRQKKNRREDDAGAKLTRLPTDAESVIICNILAIGSFSCSYLDNVFSEQGLTIYDFRFEFTS